VDETEALRKSLTITLLMSWWRNTLFITRDSSGSNPAGLQLADRKWRLRNRKLQEYL